MAFYYLFPIISLFIVLSGYRKERTGLIIMLVMLFFSMFRGIDVGKDTSIYLEELPSQAGYLLSLTTESIGVSKFELLYDLFCFIILYYNFPPVTILYILSLITFIFLYLSAKRFQVSTALVFLFYIYLGFYYHSFNIARQLAALSIGLYALSFVTETTSKRYVFFILVLIAALIHNSLIIFSILYFLRYISLDRRVLALFIYIFYVFATLVPITPVFFKIMGGMDLFYNDSYGGGGIFAVVDRTIIGIMYNIVSGTVLLVVFLNRRTTQKTDLLDNLLLFSMVVSASLTYGNLGTNRIIMAFAVIQCIYFAECLRIKPSKTLQIAFLFLLVINYYMTIQITDGKYYLQFI